MAEVMAGIVAERNKCNAETRAKLKDFPARDLAASCSWKSILERFKKLIGRHKA